MTTLIPKIGSRWISVATVVQRASAEFACVVTDQTRAMRHLAEELVAKEPNIEQQEADRYLQPLVESVEMICADDRRSDDRFLKCLVVPEQPIEIVYHFDGHKEAGAKLLDRLARVLDYEIKE